jgi:hypothetical protein
MRNSMVQGYSYSKKEERISWLQTKISLRPVIWSEFPHITFIMVERFEPYILENVKWRKFNGGGKRPVCNQMYIWFCTLQGNQRFSLVKLLFQALKTCFDTQDYWLNFET